MALLTLENAAIEYCNTSGRGHLGTSGIVKTNTGLCMGILTQLFLCQKPQFLTVTSGASH